MEHAFPELLAREDILRILQEERKISGISNLPYNELLHIFKTFAVPLAKRDARKAKHKSGPLKRAVDDSHMDVDESFNPKKQMMVPNFDTIRAEIICLCEKRRIDDSLSSATKRIKITYP